MKKLKLDLELALPKDAGACDACVKRIVTALDGKPGISEVHVDLSAPSRPLLCLHYDGTSIRMDRVRKLVEEAGAELAKRFEHLSVPVSGLRHERQGKLVDGALRRIDGVLNVSSSAGTHRVFIEFDPAKTSRDALLDSLGRAGVGLAPEAKAHDATEKEHHDHDHDHGGPFGERSELIFSLACGAFTLAGWLVQKFLVQGAIPTVVFGVAYVLGAWFTLKELVVALRARKLEIDFLMLLAAAGAAILGEWFEGALLLFLFTLGHALEGFAMGRARKAIEGLAKLVPATALLIEDGVEREVPVEALTIGARIVVKPNTRLPSDGFVEQGTGSINQAPITGESIPVEKVPVGDSEVALRDAKSVRAESRVFAGTINGASALTIRVTKVSSDSTLSRVVKMVSEAQTQKSATQLFTDKFERIFVPIILSVVVILLFAWVVVDEPFSKSLYRALAVLVAASPCALAIATPSAVLSGVARAARGGVLVKGGAHLESLGRITAIAFDKTGTLTEGKPHLTDVRTAKGSTDAELLQVALAVEKQSDHPLASAIVLGAQEMLAGASALEAVDTKAIVGFGLEATVEGARVQIGKPGLFTKAEPLPAEVAAFVSELEGSGRTVMLVQRGSTFLGVLGVMDTPRDSARVVIRQLHELGVETTIMLTGDNQKVADAVAKEVGIDVARGDLLPEDKVSAVAELARKGRVAMVGDGVNDAPAMASATVGIAMGAGGSDVALETADIALMADDLSALPFAVGLSRAARRIIQQNLWASLGMVAFLIPATIFGLAGIGTAVVLHEGSTMLVVVNALRLLAYRKPALQVTA